LQLDSQAPRTKVAEYFNSENRFRMLTKSKPEAAKKYFEQAQLDVETRWKLYQYMAARPMAPEVISKSVISESVPNSGQMAAATTATKL
jgi:pyruvate-ferredoxin/flavodoxin oxidoreductase